MDAFTFVLIDDSPEELELFSFALRRIDSRIRFIGFNQASTAIEFLSEKNTIPDCIYIDINMPEMGDGQCMLEIKKIEHLRTVPKYIYSGLPEGARDKYIEMGIRDFAPKSTQLDDLILNLRIVLSHHRKQ